MSGFHNFECFDYGIHRNPTRLLQSLSRAALEAEKAKLSPSGLKVWRKSTLRGYQRLATTCAISVVIPAYNESERLAPSLDRVLAFLRAHSRASEIIVVDDGSTDRTPEIVRDYARQNGSAVRLLQNPGNRGKGYSVRHGMLKASGATILFTDADLSSPIEEATKLFSALDSGADIAIGSRWARAELQTKRQSLARQVLGRVFNGVLRLILGLHFKDTQCGFKAFRREAAKSLFPLQRIEGWGFDPEILFLAQKLGFRIDEVPVVWGHDSRTRISPVVDGTRMVAEMLRIRSYSLAGKYPIRHRKLCRRSVRAVEPPDVARTA